MRARDRSDSGAGARSPRVLARARGDSERRASSPRVLARARRSSARRARGSKALTRARRGSGGRARGSMALTRALRLAGGRQGGSGPREGQGRGGPNHYHPIPYWIYGFSCLTLLLFKTDCLFILQIVSQIESPFSGSYL